MKRGLDGRELVDSRLMDGDARGCSWRNGTTSFFSVGEIPLWLRGAARKRKKKAGAALTALTIKRKFPPKSERLTLFAAKTQMAE